MEKFTINRLKNQFFFEYILLFIYLIVGYILFKHYLQSGLIKYLGILLFPYLTIFQKNEPPNKVYPLFAILLMILSFLIHAQSLYFLAFIFTFFFLLENIFGKLNNLPVFYVLILSTIFEYFINVFTVPIRLELSNLANILMNLIGFKSKAYGNMIYLGEQVFAVDTACIGLNMLTISFMLALFFLAHFERENKIKLSFLAICLFLSFTFLLTIFSNLIRIIILVIFHVLPENKTHDLVGLLCLTIYVLIPSYFLANLYIVRFKNLTTQKLTNDARFLNLTLQKNYVFFKFFPFIMLAFILIKYFHTKEIVEKQNIKVSQIKIEGFKKEIIADVGKFTKENTLLYIKPIKSFFATEHNPMICWIGSGYELKKIRQESWEGKEIYTALLVKNESKIYTAWWYKSDSHQTIHQLEWRWKMLTNGKTYYLINMNTETKEDLKKEVLNYFEKY